MNRSRGWCFTINNPSSWDQFELEAIKDDPSVQYLIWGTERGENNTPHFQGFIRFKTLKSFVQVQSLLTRAHIEIQRGTCQQAADYCKKDGNFIEHGELPEESGKRTKQMWKSVIQWAESGQLERIKDEFPHIYFLHFGKIMQLRDRASGILSGPLQNEWWVGPTGTGKSRLLWEMYPDHYSKACNKWWDGYSNESVVAIEELSPDHGRFLGHFLKIWADRYPFTPEIKGGHLKRIRPEKIIVLSNYEMHEVFEKPQDLEPLLRRFKVKRFNPYFL